MVTMHNFVAARHCSLLLHIHTRKLCLQEQQGRVLDMVDSLSVSTQAALSGLETRLLALQARLDSCLPGLLPPPPPCPQTCCTFYRPVLGDSCSTAVASFAVQACDHSRAVCMLCPALWFSATDHNTLRRFASAAEMQALS